jgi:hypothetical protein
MTSLSRIVRQLATRRVHDHDDAGEADQRSDGVVASVPGLALNRPKTPPRDSSSWPIDPLARSTRCRRTCVSSTGPTGE